MTPDSEPQSLVITAFTEMFAMKLNTINLDADLSCKREQSTAKNTTAQITHARFGLIWFNDFRVSVIWDEFQKLIDRTLCASVKQVLKLYNLVP